MKVNSRRLALGQALLADPPEPEQLPADADRAVGDHQPRRPNCAQAPRVRRPDRGRHGLQLAPRQPGRHGVEEVRPDLARCLRRTGG